MGWFLLSVQRLRIVDVGGLWLYIYLLYMPYQMHVDGFKAQLCGSLVAFQCC